MRSKEEETMPSKRRGFEVDIPAQWRPAKPGSTHPDRNLHICFDCSSEFVYPAQWEEAGPNDWSVLLHCPNCDVFRDGIFTDEAVKNLEDELDRGAECLARDYEWIMQANMAKDVERFAHALALDGILPEDF